MRFPYRKYTPIIGSLLVLTVGATATPLFAASDDPTANNAASESQAYAIHNSYGGPVVATEAPSPDGTGPNPGESPRVDMQNNPKAFAQMGTHYPAAPGVGNVAGVDANNVALHGRAGWNPALVQLQATPAPFPWQAQQAAASRKGEPAKTAAAGADR
jgi:hypothetical protein